MSRLLAILFPSGRRVPDPMAGAGGAATPALSIERTTSVRTVRMLSLATATRDYARSVENNTFERLCLSDLARLWEPMGPDLWAWQYARRLTGQSAWRARPDVDESRERVLSAHAMVEDVETWVRAMRVLDERIARARLHGTAIPEPLAVPAAVRDVLDARDAAALERIGRKRGGVGEGRTDPAAIPDDAVHHPAYPGRPA